MKKVYCVMILMFLSLAVFSANNFYFTYGTGFSSSASSISFGYSVSSPDLSTSTGSGGWFYGRIIFSGPGGNRYIKSFTHRFVWGSSGVAVLEPITYTEVPNGRFPPSTPPLTAGSTTVTVPVNTACVPNGTYTVFLELYSDWPPGVEVPHNAWLHFAVGSTITNYDDLILYHNHPSGLQIDHVSPYLLYGEGPIASGAIGTFTVSSGSSFAGSTTITPGNCTTLPIINTTTTGGTSPYTLYYWNGSGISGSASSSSSAVNLPGLTHGTYNLAMVDGNGCRWDYTITTVKPITTVTITPTDQVVCRESCIKLSANPSGGGAGYTYTWSHSRPGIASSTISTAQNFKTTPQYSSAAYTANTYTVSVSNAYCTATNATVQTVKRSCIGNGVCSQSNNPAGRFTSDLNEEAYFSDQSLELFPNPAATLLNIRFGELEVENGRIEVYDAMGKQLQTQAVSPGAVSMEMDVSTLPEGLYLLRFVTPDAVLFSGKFMHQ